MSDPSNIGRKLFRFASARWLTPVLGGAGFLAFLISLVLGASESRQVAAGIEISFGGAEITRLVATNPLAWSYFALLVTHLFCRWLAAVLADRDEPDISLAEKDHILADAWRYGIVLDSEDWERVAEDTLSRGAMASAGAGRAVYRVRPSNIPLRTWQLGLIVFAMGLVLSTVVRQSGTVELGEGQVLGPGTQMKISRYDWRFPTDLAAPMPFEALRLDQGGVDLGLDSKLLPRNGPILRWPIAARLAYLDDGEERGFVARSYPPILANGQLVSLNGVGLGPRVVLEQDGRTVLDTFTRLDIVPGRSTESSVTFEQLPYSLRFKLLPSTQSSALDSSYQLLVVDDRGGRGIVASQTVGPFSESLVFAGWRISVPETRAWVSVSITRDPALALVGVGLLMTLAGLLAWFVVLAIGWEQWMFVEADAAKGTRLYVGVDASRTRRSRARRRLETMLRTLGGRSGAQDEGADGGSIAPN